MSSDYVVGAMTGEQWTESPGQIHVLRILAVGSVQASRAIKPRGSLRGRQERALVDKTRCQEYGREGSTGSKQKLKYVIMKIIG